MSVIAQSAIQKKLMEGFTEARLRNPQVSMRAYAKRVALSPAALSEILRGKRSLSQKRTKVLLEKMNLEPGESHRILSLFESRSAENGSGDVNSEIVQITNDQFSAVSAWYHFAILSLIDTEGFQSNTDWIADRLGIKRRESKEAIDRLLRLELIIEAADGRWARTKNSLMTTDDVHTLARRRAEGENLELARKALEEDETHDREFGSITLPMSPEKLPIAKKLIRDFLTTLADAVESQSRTEVFKLNIQMFQVSKEVSPVRFRLVGEELITEPELSVPTQTTEIESELTWA